MKHWLHHFISVNSLYNVQTNSEFDSPKNLHVFIVLFFGGPICLGQLFGSSSSQEWYGALAKEIFNPNYAWEPGQRLASADLLW